MNVVRLENLEPHREMVDVDIAELSIMESMPLSRATLRYAQAQLDLALIVTGSWVTNWWSCLPLPVSAMRASPNDSDWSDVDPKRIARFVLDRTTVARKPYDAAVAAICRAIQPDIDVLMNLDEFAKLYPASEVQTIASASPLQMPPSELESEQLLFESHDAYLGRLKRVNVHFRIVLGTYDRLGIDIPALDD